MGSVSRGLFLYCNIIGGRVFKPAMDAPVYYSKAEFIETV